MTDGWTLEIAVDSLTDARTAADAGAHRVELCSGLSVGGLTPSAGTVETVLAGCSLPCMVLIRPRPGDFVYDSAEITAMERDVEFACAAGARGVVLGALRVDGRVDVETVAALVRRARPASVTFHRALDLCQAPLEALDALIDLGVERVLTSGGQAQVGQGLDLLEALVKHAAGRITIMAGGGLRASDVRPLAALGIREVHASAGLTVPSAMEHRNLDCPMASAPPPGEYERRRTSADICRELRCALDAAFV